MKSIQNTPGQGGHLGGWWKRFSGIRSLDRFDGILIIMIGLYTTVFSYLSIFKYNTFQFEYDLAVFNQALLNTISNGGILTNSLEYGSHFGVHFSPVLFFLVPLYALFPGPHILLIVQSLLLGLGAIPIYLCGREILGKAPGCVVGVLYLLYPSLHGVNLFEFHEVAFLPLLLGMALWCFVTGRKNWLLLFGILSLFVKEDVSLIVCMIGLIGLYQTRRNQISERWQYFVLIAISIFTLILFFVLIKPIFASSGVVNAPEFLNQYVDPLTSIFQFNSYTYRIEYILKSFIPILFVPLLAPEILVISVPSFLEILLAGSAYYSIWFHYSALIIPGLFISTIMGLSIIQSREGSFGKRIIVPLLMLMIVSSIFCTVSYSPAMKQIGLMGSFDEKMLKEHREYVNLLVSDIPSDASISTQYNLLPFVSNHPKIMVDYVDGADIILLDNAFPWRAKDFSDDIQKIKSNYNLILNKNYIELYINKENTVLQSKMNRSVSHLS